MCTTEDSNRLAHPFRLIKVFVIRLNWETLHLRLSRLYPVNILIRLREYAGWSESLLGQIVRRYIFWNWDCYINEAEDVCRGTRTLVFRLVSPFSKSVSLGESSATLLCLSSVCQKLTRSFIWLVHLLGRCSIVWFWILLISWTSSSLRGIRKRILV